MTTIGTAVLQIIPSLKGVSEEIEKQLDGKTIEVAVAPKVDPAAAQKAGKDAGTAVAKSANDAASKTPIQPKVDKPAAEKAGKDAGDSITKGAKDAVRKGDIGKTVSDEVTDSVKESSPGKELAKIIVDGLADGAKGELQDGGIAEVIVDGLAEGIKQGIDSDGVGGQVVDSIAGAVRDGNLGGTIKDAVLPTIKTIGTEIRAGASEWAQGIGDSLRSGDIQGATSEIASAVQNTTNLISGIGDAFGVQTTEVQQFGDDVSNALIHIGDTAATSHDQVNSVITPLQTVSTLAGPESKLYKAGSKLPIVGAIVELIPALRDANSQLEGVVAKYTGLNIPLSGESWLRWLATNAGNLGALENSANAAKDAAVAAAAANAAPVQRGNAVPGDTYRGPGRSTGGMIPGFSTTDDRIGIVAGRTAIGLAGGEGIVNAPATRRLGGAPFIDFLNGFADGGVVGGPDVLAATALAGTKYSQGARTDCSGMVARVIDRTLGMPEEGLMSTKTAAEWLAARGFIKGTGGPGQVSVGWYDHGPNPNDGHMAMTLSDGRNAESGGSSGPFTIGGNAAGASSPKFDQHMFLPTLYGEGPAGSSAASAPASSGSSGGSSAAPTPTASSGGGGSSSGGGGTSLPASFSGLATAPLDAMTRLGASRDGPGHRDPMKHFPEAASAAVSGQIDSALGVLGINGSPAFLDAASTLLGGISVGGHDPSGVSDGSLFNGSNLFNFGGAAPLSASSTSGGTPPPDDAHGTRAGQAAGPGVTYNIQSRDTEDAFIKANRIQSERKAAKLSVY